MVLSFAQRWLDKERDCGLADISEGMVRATVNLDKLEAESRILMTESGLPGSAAPCLSFRKAALMPRVWEIYAPGKWNRQKKAHLLQYRMLGSDGAGNPICVDETTGGVFLLDHEDGFRSVQFVNSTIAHLAETLLLYLGKRDADEFSNALQGVDAPALFDGSFWWHEIAQLREFGE